MDDTAEPVAVHLLIGLACLLCKVDRLGTPDLYPVPGSPVFCGGCGSLMVLDADADDQPVLRRARALEREQLLRRPDVQRIRDAYALDQVEARLRRVSDKPKVVKNVTGRRARVRSGDVVRLDFRGPEA